MRLNELRDNPGATKSRKRVGRGIGSGKGKTAGRGVKGQKSRSGNKVNGFEGGQNPFYRRLPKRGFNNPNAQTFAEINLDTLQTALDNKKLDASKTITEQALEEAGVVTRIKDGVRLLGRGKLETKVNLEISGATKTATAAVEKQGGKITLLTSTPKKAESKAETKSADNDNK